MSICLRTVSSKLLPINAIVSSRQPSSKVETKHPRQQYLEEHLIAPHILNNPTEGHSEKYDFYTRQSEDWHSVINSRILHTENKRLFQRRSSLESPTTLLRSRRMSEIRLNNSFNDMIYRSQNVDYFSLDEWKRSAERNWSALDDPQYTNIIPNTRTDVMKPPLNLKLEELLAIKVTPEAPQDGEKLVPREKLDEIKARIENDIPKLFAEALDYSYYSPNIQFIDNIRGIKTKGLYAYIKQVAYLRLVGHLKFAYVKFEFLKISVKYEDGTIIARWRIKGISGLRVMLTFWRYKLWKLKEMLDDHDVWYDGVSTFCVSPDGLIEIHAVEPVIRDDNKVMSGANVPYLAKVAMLLGLNPERVTWEGDLEPAFIKSEKVLQEYLRSVIPILKLQKPPPQCT